jgi:hypothetical protein
MERLTLKSIETAVKALPYMQGNLLLSSIMHHVFAMVAPKGDWKGPINATLNAATCDVEPAVIYKAVEFMTAAPCTIVETGTEIHVKSIGYRAGPAGP